MQVISLVCYGYQSCSAGHMGYQQRTTPSHCSHLQGERGFGLWPASVLIHWGKLSQLQLCLGRGREELCLGFCPNKWSSKCQSRSTAYLLKTEHLLRVFTYCKEKRWGGRRRDRTISDAGHIDLLYKKKEWHCSKIHWMFPFMLLLSVLGAQEWFCPSPPPGNWALAYCLIIEQKQHINPCLSLGMVHCGDPPFTSVVSNLSWFFSTQFFFFLVPPCHSLTIVVNAYRSTLNLIPCNRLQSRQLVWGKMD